MLMKPVALMPKVDAHTLAHIKQWNWFEQEPRLKNIVVMFLFEFQPNLAPQIFINQVDDPFCLTCSLMVFSWSSKSLPPLR